jgi:predicted kinase
MKGNTMKELVLFTGNIGTGKSLMAAKYAKNGYVIINNDSLVRMTNGGEYARYNPDHRSIHMGMETMAITEAITMGMPVVIDRTCMSAKERSRYVRYARVLDIPIICIDFGPGNGKSLLRRIHNPKGVDSKTWTNVHNSMSERYEEPTIEEGFAAIQNAPACYSFHAFDFDGTIVTNEFPEIGTIFIDMESHMKALWLDKSNIIIIWTCRSGDYLNQMRKFLIDNKIPYDFINENPMVNYGSPKVYANFYYDDHNA